MQYGHFDNEKREYVIDRVDLPTSWTNYLGVEDTCVVVNHTAGGYMFYKTPEYHRITRFRGNSVPMDRPGHYVYLRDAQTGDYWSVSWQPVAKPLDEAKYTCRHGLSYTVYECDYSDIKASQTLCVPIGSNLELWDVRIKNEGKETRDLQVFSYCEFSFHHIMIDNQNFQMSLYCAGSSYEDGIIEHDLLERTIAGKALCKNRKKKTSKSKKNPLYRLFDLHFPFILIHHPVGALDAVLIEQSAVAERIAERDHPAFVQIISCPVESAKEIVDIVFQIEDGELIPALPVYLAVLADGVLQKPGGGLDQRIAGGVAHDVVCLLQVVQIDDDIVDVFLLLLELQEILFKAVAVVNAGQVIVDCHLVDGSHADIRDPGHDSVVVVVVAHRDEFVGKGDAVGTVGGGVVYQRGGRFLRGGAGGGYDRKAVVADTVQTALERPSGIPLDLLHRRDIEPPVDRGEHILLFTHGNDRTARFPSGGQVFGVDYAEGILIEHGSLGIYVLFTVFIAHHQTDRSQNHIYDDEERFRKQDVEDAHAQKDRHGGNDRGALLTAQQLPVADAVVQDPYVQQQDAGVQGIDLGAHGIVGVCTVPVAQRKNQDQDRSQRGRDCLRKALGFGDGNLPLQQTAQIEKVQVYSQVDGEHIDDMCDLVDCGRNRVHVIDGVERDQVKYGHGDGAKIVVGKYFGRPDREMLICKIKRAHIAEKQKAYKGCFQ